MTFVFGARGDQHWKWNGGVRQLVNGYYVRYTPGHPRAGINSVVYEHVLVAEKALGRPLSVEHPVHHVDLDRTNNANSNLVVCQDEAYHNLLHVRQRAYDACGNANARKCVFCKRYSAGSELTICKTGRAYHKPCNAAYELARKNRKADLYNEDERPAA